MPDLDRLPRGLRPAWRAVADALRGQQPPPVVGDAVDKALARTVRHAGGLQWLVGLAGAVAACQEQGSLRPLEAFTESLEPARATGVGSAFVDAGWSLAAAAEEPSGAPGSLLDTLVQTGLERMVDKLCVGPLEPDMVPAVFPSADDLSTYVERCIAEVQVERLARQITRGGCSGVVRAPRTCLSRPGTEGLLHEPIA